MRHFAAGSCVRQGIEVRYVELDDPANTQSFRSELARAAAELRADGIAVTEPGEWRVLDDMRGWAEVTGLPVEILPDDRFFCSTSRFARWAEGSEQLRMELFYRDMRRRTGLLMRADGEPEGGRWNFDADNRKPLPNGLALPEPLRVEPDAVTRGVLALVTDRFGHHFGELDAVLVRGHPGRRAASAGPFRGHGAAAASATTRTRCGRARTGCSTARCPNT